MEYQSFTRPDGSVVKAAPIEAPGLIDLPGVSGQVGQWVVEEEKIADGVKVFSHSVIDGPDPSWKGYVAPEEVELSDADAARRRLVDEISSMPEAEVIDKARLYGIEGKPGEPLKSSLVNQLVDHLVAGGGVAKPGERVTEFPDVAVVEPIDVDRVTGADQKAADVVSEAADEGEGRPSGNAGREEWAAFRLSQGYSPEDLEGRGRDELRDDANFR
jgi:hypothetical protein